MQKMDLGRGSREGGVVVYSFYLLPGDWVEHLGNEKLLCSYSSVYSVFCDVIV